MHLMSNKSHNSYILILKELFLYIFQYKKIGLPLGRNQTSQISCRFLPFFRNVEQPQKYKEKNFIYRRWYMIYRNFFHLNYFQLPLLLCCMQQNYITLQCNKLLRYGTTEGLCLWGRVLSFCIFFLTDGKDSSGVHKSPDNIL